MAVVLAVGLGGGYVWMKQSQVAGRGAEDVPGGAVAKPVDERGIMGGSKSMPVELLDLSSPSEAGGVEGAKGFVAPAIDEAQPGEEGEP